MKKVNIFPLVFLMAISLWNCNRSKSVEQPEAKPRNNSLSEGRQEIRITREQFENLNLELTSVGEHYFGKEISATGMLDVPPSGRAVISAQIGGYIKRAPLLVGDRVRKGQLLLTIENIEFLELQQQYLEASEQLVYLKSDYDRQQELYSEKITSEKSFLKAESDYRRTLATCLGLEKKLQLLQIDPEKVKQGMVTSEAKIYAPISGDITQVHTKTGSFVSPSEEIMEIVNTEHMHLELNIFEKDIMKIKEGQPVYFRLPETGSKQFSGEIHLIGKSINADRTVKVHAHIDEEQKEGFVPGMYVQAAIMTDQAKVIAIDSKAVFGSDSDAVVLELVSEEDGNYIFDVKKIEIGSSDDAMTQVVNTSDFDMNARFLMNSGSISQENLLDIIH